MFTGEKQLLNIDLKKNVKCSHVCSSIARYLCNFLRRAVVFFASGVALDEKCSGGVASRSVGRSLGRVVTYYYLLKKIGQSSIFFRGTGPSSKLLCL